MYSSYRPGSLWILNPSLLLQPNKAYDSEASDKEPLLTSSSGGQYGAITGMNTIVCSHSWCPQNYDVMTLYVL